MTKACVLKGVAVLALMSCTAACTDSVRQGTGSSFLIVQNIVAGDDDDNTLHSDVADDEGGIFNDLARVTFSLGLKDPGRLTAPSQNLAITVDRYHVRYIRADGRNTPGVDVPHPFDGSFTVTVLEGEAVTASFQIVRHIAKAEAPLGALASNRVIISTIAEITFYGRDQVGHEVSATARMGVDFGNFADPE